MRDMRLLIRRLADEGMTVLLSSHLLGEVEELCNRVAIVRSGRIVYEGTIAALARGAGTIYRLATTDDERARADLSRHRRASDRRRVEHGKLVFTADEAGGRRAVPVADRGRRPDPRARPRSRSRSRICSSR